MRHLQITPLTVKILSTGTDRSEQTVLAQTRLLLLKVSDTALNGAVRSGSRPFAISLAYFGCMNVF